MIVFLILLLAFAFMVMRFVKRVQTMTRAPFAALGAPPDAAERMGSLAMELMTPGGRPNDEVMREAAAVFEQLPPELRTELEKHGVSEPGVHVEVNGPLGHAVARMAGYPAPPPAPGETERPSSWTVTAAGTTADAPQPAPVEPIAPVVVPEPVVVPVPEPVTRFGILAPDVLTGDEETPPGSVPEGWYRTADGTRERWHNGASWTAHERAPGGY